MGLRQLIISIFIRARGDSGPDLSRGALSDRIREAAVTLLSARSDGWVLEVGVGEGLLAEEVVSRGIARSFIGMDILSDNLRAARERIGKARAFWGVCARGEALPFRPSAFARVVCVNTLHNQPSWTEVEAIIVAAGRLVREGGSLIIDIRNGWDPLINLAYRYSTVLDPSTKRLPVRAYRLGRVRTLLGHNGFQIVNKTRIYYPYWCLPSAYVIEARR